MVAMVVVVVVADIAVELSQDCCIIAEFWLYNCSVVGIGWSLVSPRWVGSLYEGIWMPVVGETGEFWMAFDLCLFL